MKLIETQGDVLKPGTYLTPDDMNREVCVIHGCNSLGVMGAGLALQVKNKFYLAFEVYSVSCRDVTDRSQLLGTYTHKRFADEKITIINAIIQLETGTEKRQVNYEAVALILERLCRTFDQHPHTVFTLAIPRFFGSALAGGNWNIILCMFKEYFNNYPNVTLYVVAYQV